MLKLAVRSEWQRASRSTREMTINTGWCEFTVSQSTFFSQSVSAASAKIIKEFVKCTGSNTARHGAARESELHLHPGPETREAGYQRVDIPLTGTMRTRCITLGSHTGTRVHRSRLSSEKAQFSGPVIAGALCQPSPGQPFITGIRA